MERTCSKCLEIKPLESFYKDIKGKNGIAYWCKVCVKINVKERRKDPIFRHKQNEWNKVWRSNPRNKETILNMRARSEQKRRTRLLGGGIYTAEEWESLKKQFNNSCVSCGIHENISKLTVDHIIPISMNGQNIISNIQPLCKSCNSSKHTKIIDYRNIYLTKN